MDTSQFPPTNWENQLQQLSPDARAYVKQLQQDSRVLRETFVLDLYAPAEVSTTLSNAIAHYLTIEVVRAAPNGEELRERITLLHHRLGDAVVYLAKGKE